MFKGKVQTSDISKNANLVPREEQVPENVTQKSAELTTIPFYEVQAQDFPKSKEMVEITDASLLARIDQLIPGFTQTGATIAAVEQVGKAGPLYTAVLKHGGDLAQSTEMPNGYRGYTIKPKGGFGEQANFLAADQSAVVAASTVATIMSVASMVVGQYYMSQINSELKELNGRVKKIQGFLDNQMYGEILSLLAGIHDITDNLQETLGSLELRRNQLSRLTSLEQTCGSLLGHVNEELNGYYNADEYKNYKDYKKKNKYKNFKEYEKDVLVAQKWFSLQKVLMEALKRIADLKYVLNLGGASRASCNTFLETHLKMCRQADYKLNLWHTAQSDMFNFYIGSNERERKGLDKAIHAVPSKVKWEMNVRSFSEATAGMIEQQYRGNHVTPSTADLFNVDMQLFSKGGKIYYLPNKEYPA